MTRQARGLDVLGLGVVAVDDLLHVEGYPPPDAKTPVLRGERQCGGLTATALVAAARLGARCAYAGTLGDDDLSRFVVARLEAEGIDVSSIVRSEGARPVHSTIIVDVRAKTRNIFFDSRGAAGAHPTLPPDDVVRSAKVLFVDQYGAAGMIRAAQIARDAGIPVVADLERDGDPRFPELLAIVDHLILSRDFAARITKEDDPGRAAAALWTDSRAAVVVTAGADGAWFVAPPDPRRPRHRPAFEVDAVDTTGCGDVFHGAYAAALAEGLALEARIEIASAAAALKATRPGGQAGSPTRVAVDDFLRQRRGARATESRSSQNS
jgi:sugar/nucleoside kinase (ribokinase family)